jgi:hypothetical protein
VHLVPHQCFLLLLQALSQEPQYLELHQGNPSGGLIPQAQLRLSGARGLLEPEFPHLHGLLGLQQQQPLPLNSQKEVVMFQ